MQASQISLPLSDMKHGRAILSNIDRSLHEARTRNRKSRGEDIILESKRKYRGR